MKVAIDARMSGKSGIGSYFDSLLPYFVKTFECVLIGDGERLKKYKAQAQIVECNIKVFSLRDTFFFPKKILKIINSCSLYYSPYCNVSAGIKVQIFTTIHDVVFLDVKGLASKIGVVARKWFYKRAVKKSVAVFSVSEFSAGRINALLQKGAKKPKKVIVTYNAANDFFAQGDATFANRKRHSLLFVGNIKRHKGLAVLLEAFKKVLQKEKDATLLIVGNATALRTKDENVMEALKTLGDCVKIEENASAEDLRKFYHTYEVLVQPSLYEGFGMPPLEALTCGAKVVLSDIEVFKEIYSGYPVHYSKVADSTSLFCAIEKAFESDYPKLSEEQKNRYSFDKCFAVIKKELEGATQDG